MEAIPKEHQLLGDQFPITEMVDESTTYWTKKFSEWPVVHVWNYGTDEAIVGMDYGTKFLFFNDVDRVIMCKPWNCSQDMDIAFGKPAIFKGMNALTLLNEEWELGGYSPDAIKSVDIETGVISHNRGVDKENS